MTAREKEELDEFITQGSFKDYIMDMEKNGSYADHIMVEAMSKLLKVSIQIIMSTGDVIIGPGFDKKIQLGYIPELQHYVAIKTKLDEVGPNHQWILRLNTIMLQTTSTASKLKPFSTLKRW